MTRPDDRFVCPMDGAHLREIRMEMGQPTEYHHLSGAWHYDRMAELREPGASGVGSVGEETKP